jgi:hypothetical protein
MNRKSEKSRIKTIGTVSEAAAREAKRPTPRRCGSIRVAADASPLVHIGAHVVAKPQTQQPETTCLRCNVLKREVESLRAKIKELKLRLRDSEALKKQSQDHKKRNEEQHARLARLRDADPSYWTWPRLGNLLGMTPAAVRMAHERHIAAMRQMHDIISEACQLYPPAIRALNPKLVSYMAKNGIVSRKQLGLEAGQR